MRRQGVREAEAKVPRARYGVDTRREHLELRRRVVPAAGISLGGARLLELDARKAARSRRGDIFALDPKRTAPELQREVGLPIFVDLLEVAHAIRVVEENVEMPFRNPAAHRCLQAR